MQVLVQGLKVPRAKFTARPKEGDGDTLDLYIRFGDISNLTTYQRNRDKFFGRFMGTWMDEVRLDADLIRENPTVAMHELMGGVYTFKLGGGCLEDMSIVEQSIEFSKLISLQMSKVVSDEQASTASLKTAVKRLQSTRQGQTISMNAGEGDYVVKGDPDVLYTAVLDELSLNALKYRHPMRDSDVSIEIKDARVEDLDEAERIKFKGLNEVVEVRFQDNGCGIPSENIGRIFEPHFTTGGSSLGGMGLSILKKTVDDMGGSVSVESTVGEGTAFVMRFPKAPEDQAAGKESRYLMRRMEEIEEERLKYEERFE